MTSAFGTTGIGSAYGKIVSGTKTIASAGTAEQIDATSRPIPGVWLAADLGNNNPVVVGDSSVVAANSSMQGIVLTPGNNSIFLAINNLNLLFVDAQTSGDELTYAYLQPADNL